MSVNPGKYRRIWQGQNRDPVINGLTADAENLYTRMTREADDFGVIQGSPGQLLALLYPMRFDEAVKTNQMQIAVEAVASSLEELCRAGLVTCYEDSESVYAMLNRFLNEQPSARNGKRVHKWPTPPGWNVKLGEVGGIQNTPDASRPIQSDPGASSATKIQDPRSNNQDPTTDQMIDDPRSVITDGGSRVTSEAEVTSDTSLATSPDEPETDPAERFMVEIGEAHRRTPQNMSEVRALIMFAGGYDQAMLLVHEARKNVPAIGVPACIRWASSTLGNRKAKAALEAADPTINLAANLAQQKARALSAVRKLREKEAVA